MNADQRWYYATGEQTYGPVATPEIENLIQQGVISSSTWIVAEGTEDWVPIESSVFARHLPPTLSERNSAELARTSVDEPSLVDAPVHDKPAAAGAFKFLFQRVVAMLLHTAKLFRSRWRVTVPGTLALGCVILLLHHYRHWRSNDHHDLDGIAQGTSSTSTGSNLDFWKPSTHSLVVKGLYVGMSGQEAAKNIVVSGHGRIWARPSTHVSGNTQAHGYDIVFNEENDPAGGWAGQIWTDPKTDQVTVFYFEGRLTDFLFNTADQSAKEFAQSFISSYGVPNLTSSEFSGRPGWIYESPQGWTLRIMVDKTVDVSKTLERSFD